MEEPGGLQFMESQRVRHEWRLNTRVGLDVLFLTLELKIIQC